MAATAHRPVTNRPSQLEHHKPRQATRQYNMTTPREPFDADLLSRKLESYRRDLKLERARRELAEKNPNDRLAIPRQDSGNTLSDATREKTEKPTGATAFFRSEKKAGGVNRSQSLKLSKSSEKIPERKRSLNHSHHTQNGEHTETSGPYVPRTAAKQFAMTTTPLKKEEQSSDPKSDISTLKQRHKLEWSAPTPRSTLAGAAAAPSTESDSAETPVRRRSSLFLHSTNTRRNQPRPLSTALENLHISEDRDNNNDDSSDESNPYILTTHNQRKPQHHHIQKMDSSPHSHQNNRPHLKHDRNDWSQASQCGDSARTSLHLRRKGEEAELAGLREARALRVQQLMGRESSRDAGARKEKEKESAERSGYRLGKKPRQKSHGDAPDGLVNEAVRIIREEKRRRSSIFGLFKRH